MGLAAQWLSVWLVIGGFWVRSALDLLDFSWECPWTRHFGVPSLVLVKPRKDMNNVSCRRDMTEISVESGVNNH